MTSRPPRDRPPGVARRDAAGGRTIGPTWESVTERLIREAQERGEFDDLPGHGRPIRLEDDPWAGEEALAFHVLRNARVAPPWIEADKEARQVRDRVEALLRRATGAHPAHHERLRRELTQLVAQDRACVARLNALAPVDRLHRRPLTIESMGARLEAAFRADRIAAPRRPSE
jgi:hypothetical protein